MLTRLFIKKCWVMQHSCSIIALYFYEDFIWCYFDQYSDPCYNSTVYLCKVLLGFKSFFLATSILVATVENALLTILVIFMTMIIKFPTWRCHQQHCSSYYLLVSLSILSHWSLVQSRLFLALIIWMGEIGSALWFELPLLCVTTISNSILEFDLKS